jgi:hypothetical protein
MSSAIGCDEIVSVSEEVEVLSEVKLRDYVKHIYIIHNPTSTYRYEKITNMICTCFPELNIDENVTFVWKVGADELKPERDGRYVTNPMMFVNRYERARLSLILNYMHALELFLKTKHNSCLILEDDAAEIPNVTIPLLNTFIPLNVYRNANMFTPTKGSRPILHGDPKNPKFHRTDGIIGTECIIFTKSSAQTLLHFIKRGGISQPLDFIMNDLIKELIRNGQTIYETRPPLFQNNSFEESSLFPTEIDRADIDKVFLEL